MVHFQNCLLFLTKNLDFTGRPYSLLLTVRLVIKVCVSNVYTILKANDNQAG